MLFLQVCYWVIRLLGICQERPDICSLHAFFDLSQLRGACEEQPFASHRWHQSLGPERHVINVRFWSVAGGQTFLWSNFGTSKEASVKFRKRPVSLEKCVSVLTHPSLCCHGLPVESPCCGINCDSLGDSHLLRLSIFTRSPVNSDSQMCVICRSLWASLKGKCPHPSHTQGSVQIKLPLHAGHLCKDLF